MSSIMAGECFRDQIFATLTSAILASRSFRPLRSFGAALATVATPSVTATGGAIAMPTVPIVPTAVLTRLSIYYPSTNTFQSSNNT